MSNIVLQGDLNYLNLGEVIQLIGSNGSSGLLRVKSPYSNSPGVMYIVNGNVVDADSGTAKGLDAAYALFGWLDSRFEFSQEPMQRDNVVKKTRMELILDGLRMVDDGLIKTLGPPEKDAGPKADLKSVAKSDKMPLIKGPLVDYMYVVDEEEFFEGEDIVIEGKHGSWIWVILEGEVEIVKETEKGPLKILKVGEGAFLGSIAALIEGEVRSATTVASGHVQLGVLDAQRLTAEFSKMSLSFRNLMISLDKRLRQVTDHAVRLYEQKNNLKEYLAGKRPLIKQGDDEPRIFTITQGEADIIRKTSKAYVPLARLTRGDFLGHIPFLDMGHEPDAASVFASQNIKVAPLNVKNLQQEYDRLSVTIRNFIEYLAICVSVTSRVACLYKEKSIEAPAGSN